MNGGMQSFLQPSFPSNMLTSTPNPRATSHKPDSIPKIPHVEPESEAERSVPQPASSSLSLLPNRDHEEMPPPQESSERPAKRARESIFDIPVPANIFPTSELESAWFAPPAKKARVEPESKSEPLVVEQEKEKEQPRPNTPQKDRARPLPTLTELLASSKHTPKSARQVTKTFAFLSSKDVDTSPSHKDASPATKTAAVPRSVVNEPPRTPDPSPTKSMFSFASASTASPGHYAPLRSPSSPSQPLSLTQNPGLFDPQATSSQPGRSGHGSLVAGSSGFLVGAGFYNSQFDVNQATERASALLEKDVNFDLWLKSDEGEELQDRVQDENDENEGEESQ